MTTQFRIGDRVERIANLTALGGAHRAHVNFGTVVNISASLVHVRNEHGNLTRYKLDGTTTARDPLTPTRIEKVNP